MGFIKDTYLEKGVSLVFILLFVYAAVSKLLDFETFQVQLAQSPLLSAYAGILVWVVPVIELVIAVLLFMDRTRIFGIHGFFFMMVLFSVYIFFILKFADFVPCSCGGVLEKMSWNQHLIFNLFFVVISGFLLFRSLRGKRQRILIIGSQLIAGVIVVSVLFAFSERKMQRNNAFQRRYVPHFSEFKKAYDLKYNSWYFAGISADQIYLGNTTAPLTLLSIDSSFTQVDTIRLTIDHTDLPFREVTVLVGDSIFAVTDGTIPAIFMGTKEDWKGFYFPSDKYFTTSILTDKNTVGLRTLSFSGLQNILEIFSTRTKNKSAPWSYPLPYSEDGIFETDGQLLWNQNLRKLVYVYFYSNQFFLLDFQSKETVPYHTIDTVRHPVIYTIKNSERNQKSLNRRTNIINLHATTSQHYLFICSERLGRFENLEMQNYASIIDVYDLYNGNYRFSFYVNFYNDRKPRFFEVSGDYLYVLSGNDIVRYDLRF